MLSLDMLNQRAGNFTASGNHRLMAGWDAPIPSRDFEGFDAAYKVMNPLYEKGLRKFLVKGMAGLIDVPKVTGDLLRSTLKVIESEHPVPPTGLVTYAKEKAIEELSSPDPSLSFSTVHTKNGEEREVEAMEKLSTATGIEFVNTGEDQIHIHADQVGCTPDGIANDEIDMIEHGGEAKCKSALVHGDNILVRNNNDMKEVLFEHFVQVQTSMLVCGLDHWHFCNFNPFFKHKELRFQYIVVERDNDFIAKMQERLAMAKAIKGEHVKKLKSLIPAPTPEEIVVPEKKIEIPSHSFQEISLMILKAKDEKNIEVARSLISDNLSSAFQRELNDLSDSRLSELS